MAPVIKAGCLPFLAAIEEVSYQAKMHEDAQEPAKLGRKQMVETTVATNRMQARSTKSVDSLVSLSVRER